MFKYLASRLPIGILSVARRMLTWKDVAAGLVYEMISSPVPSRNCLGVVGSAAAKWRPPAKSFAGSYQLQFCSSQTIFKANNIF